MPAETKKFVRVYLTLVLLSTFATAFIWGINTLFLLDAGLSIAQAFAANAFFTVGQVIFEVPTGVVADTWGRRTSYILGTITLLAATLFYLYLWQIHGAFWLWALSSIFLGLGFTFFSGATEAWLVDGLQFSGFKGKLEAIFAKGQMAGGIAMLGGTVAGGVIAQSTNLGVPYILRAVMLGLTFIVAVLFMKDEGFTPRKSETPAKEMRRILKASIENGFKNPPVRWIMLAWPTLYGVSFFAFYAMQPHLLNLYGNPNAYSIAALAAAIAAGAQILGGLTISSVTKYIKRRTSILFGTVLFNILALVFIGLTGNFWVAVGLFVVWSLSYAASMPIRSAYINGLIPSSERATVLSFDSLFSNTGGIAAQPALGKVADIFGYPTSYIAAGLIQFISLPFLLLARRTQAKSDFADKIE